MKQTRTHTLRGQLTVASGATTSKKTLIVDDGRINTGYKIRDFFVWCAMTSNSDFNAQLSMQPIILGGGSDASDNTQIAWVQQPSALFKEYIIDPDHIIVRDLYITLQQADPDDYNYMIVMDEYDISDDEAIINIIKEGSQALD